MACSADCMSAVLAGYLQNSAGFVEFSNEHLPSPLGPGERSLLTGLKFRMHGDSQCFILLLCNHLHMIAYVCG